MPNRVLSLWEKVKSIVVTGSERSVIKNPVASSVKGIREPKVIVCSTCVFKLVESILIYPNRSDASIVSVQVTTRSSTKQRIL